MERKKITVFLKISILLLLVIQVPFVYELLQSYWLESYLQSLPARAEAATPFRDVKGFIHVHSAAGGHSLGTYPEIIEAGKKAGAEWILMTEHPREPDLYNRITDPGLLMIYGWEEARDEGGRLLRDDNSEFLVFSEFGDEKVPEDALGIEIFNLAESAADHNTPYSWVNWVYHSPTMPEMFFFQVWDINRRRLDRWDNVLEMRHITATAGNDAHQNLGLILEKATGDEILRVQVDPYELSMKTVSNHLLLPETREISEENVLKALKQGSSYICFDLLGNPEGFSFHAENRQGVFPPGSVVSPGSKLRLISPFPVHFRIIWSGKTFKELEGTDFTVPASLEGPYRVEVYLIDPPKMLKDKPWIITNPIYVGGSS